MPKLKFNYDAKWIISKTAPRFRAAMNKSLAEGLTGVVQNKVYGSALTPTELKLELEKPHSEINHLLFAHALQIFTEESRKNTLLNEMNLEAIQRESEAVQKIEPIEWQTEEAKQILPDPKRMKDENKDLAEELKREMEKLKILRKEHHDCIQYVKTREEQLVFGYDDANGKHINGYKDDFISGRASNSDMSKPPSAFMQWVDNAIPSMFNSLRQKFNHITEHAAESFSRYQKSSGAADVSQIKPETLAAHSEVQLQISFLGQYSEVAEGRALLKPSEIRKMNQEKNAQGQTRFQKVKTMSADTELAKLDKNEQAAAKAVTDQEQVVQAAAAKLDASNKSTKVVNDQSWMSSKDPKVVKKNSAELAKTVGKDKSPEDAAKSFSVAIREKVGQLADAAKKSFSKFIGNLVNKVFGGGDKGSKDEAEATSKKQASLKRGGG